jgi:hypothetical protein
MGFRALLYNSIKMYLVAKEIIQGDQHDESNAFQLDHIQLHLPGTSKSKPSEAWITKRQKDGSLASNFVCFVDNQRVTGEGRHQVIAVGHAIITQESYLGLQDALRKLRAMGGLRWPGAWAGACVFNKEDLGVVTLTSQDKWDHLKL